MKRDGVNRVYSYPRTRNAGEMNPSFPKPSLWRRRSLAQIHGGEAAKKLQLTWVKSYPVFIESQPKKPKNPHQLDPGDGRPELARTKGE